MKSAILLIILFSLTTFASTKTLDGYYKRFNLVRNDEDQVIAITDNTLATKFTIRPYIKTLIEKLTGERKLMRANNDDYFKHAEKILFKDFDNKLVSEDKKKKKIRKYSMKSLRHIIGLNIEKIFKNENLQKVLNKYEKEVRDEMLQYKINVLARLDKPRYFYKNRFIYNAAGTCLDYASAILIDNTLFGIAKSTIKNVEGLLKERRAYHQNILLYYLENFDPEQLNLTNEEADLALSSIYESKLGTFSFFKSLKVKKNWKTFGVDSFAKDYEISTLRLRNNLESYENIGERINSSFNIATKDGKEIIINLFNASSVFSSAPALAYDFVEPNRIRKKRTLTRLIRIGLNLAPIPFYYTSLIKAYLRSTYAEQKITEGSLYAYFEVHELEEMRINMLKQWMNPFVTIE